MSLTLSVSHYSTTINPHLEIKCGDALTQLQSIPNETVDCCITSPPYWALRDYKTDGQLGLEPTITEYINKLIQIFDQVKRVLKKTGTCWVVIGDTYAGTGHKEGAEPDPKRNEPRQGQLIALNNKVNGIPNKSLCLIPERFAIAMIDKGWILRNKIIWYKPNCMPSSAKDRFTVDWEYVYFFTKSQRYYFETQYEPFISTDGRPFEERVKHETWGGQPKKSINGIYPDTKMYPNWSKKQKLIADPLGRIKRCVWKISTKPFSGAHFAVFPPRLIEPMIKAGCPVDGGIVLDPFMGAGTTGLVALQNARDFIGIELNAEYIKLAEQRLKPYLQQTRLIT